MTVVSEGAETENRAALLHLLNGSIAQGYYFARAISPSDLKQWIILCQPDGSIPRNICA